MIGNSNRIIIFFFGALVFIFFHLIFNHFFPNNNNLMGHDYAYFFPHLLDGFLWYQENGWFSTFWFTPSFCGGIVNFGNPLDIYTSVPQLLTLIIEPLYAVYLTFILFAVIGYISFYFLLRQSFELSSSSSLLGATLFLFNGYYIYHLIVGHLTFHGIMLMPLISYFLIKIKNKDSVISFLFFCSIAALLISYLIYSGISSQLLYILFAIGVVGVTHSIKFGMINRFLSGFFLSIIIAVLLSLYKIVAVLSYLKNFPRDEYLLPGFDSVVDLIKALFGLLFFGESSIDKTSFINNSVRFLQHEWEFGITFIPLLIFLLFILRYLFKKRDGSLSLMFTKSYKSILFLILLLLIPLLINYYASDWNAILKKIPVIKSNITLLRWFFVYIPFVIILSSLAFDKIFIKNIQKLIASLLLIACIIAINLYSDKAYYHQQSYDPETVNKMYNNIKKGQYDIEISNIGTRSFSPFHENKEIYLNDLLVVNTSQLFCYEPVFGYSLEWFPKKNLHVGSVLEINKGYFNLKNPACYIFPDENGCQPGEHFNVSQENEVNNFRQYKKISFNMSPILQYGFHISLGTLVLIFIALIVFLWSLFLEKFGDGFNSKN